VTPLDEIVRAFDDLARQGKVLYAGLSNFPAWMTARAVTLAELGGQLPIAGVQFEYSLVERSGDRDNLPMAEALGIGAALWSPLGGGVLSGKYRTGNEGRLTDWQGRLTHTEDDDRKAATIDAVLAAADDLGLPAAQVAVAWLLERARRSASGVVPIIGPRTPEQLDSYVASLDVALGDEWYTKLDEASRIDLGQPHTQIASQRAVALGGDADRFRLHPVPSS
jgi:aryl-alcohol dehydrogenase-like predicted oxidoreductase